MVASSLTSYFLAMRAAAGGFAAFSRVPLLIAVVVLLVARGAFADDPVETQEKKATEDSIAWVEGQVLVNGIPVPGLVIEFDSDRKAVDRGSAEAMNPTAVTDEFGSFVIPKPEEDADATPRLVPGKYAVRLWAKRGDMAELAMAYEAADDAEEALEEVDAGGGEDGGEVKDADGFQQVPAEFNSKSSLEFEIAERSNSIMINIDVDAEVAGALVEQAEAARAAEEELFMAANNPFQQMGAMDPAEQFLVRYAKVRCALLRRCCEVSEEQDEKLKELSGEWLKDAVEKASKKQGGGVVAGMARFLGGAIGGRAVPRQPVQPHEVIGIVRSQVDEKIKELLTEDQTETLNAEVEAWQEFRTHSLAKLMIASLDRHLFLSVSQREELLPEVKKWMEKKNPYWQFYFQNSNYIPDIPTTILRKHLEDDQLSALQGMQKYMYEADQMEWQMMNNNGAVIFLQE